MEGFAVKPLDGSTWSDFSGLVEKHNGVGVAAGAWPSTRRALAARNRGAGVAAAALDGALQQIVDLGGGVVESYPEDVEGRLLASSFLHNGAVAMFKRHGFVRTRRIGKNRWVVTKLLVPK